MSRWWPALVVVVASACSVPAGRVSGPEAHRLVQEGAKLVDVRTPDEYQAGHIEGAINVPLAELESRLPELGPREGVLVLYCRSGRRSAQAAEILRGRGYAAVRDLGGMDEW